MACMHKGSYHEAQKYSVEGFESASSMGLNQDAGWHQLFTGMLAVAEGEHEAARDALENSAVILKEIKHNLYALPLAMLAYSARARRDDEQANSYLDLALKSGIDNRSFFLIVNCLPIAALQFADWGNIERAAELYGLARTYDYVANSKWFSDVVGQELSRAIDSIPVDLATKASERGRELDLWETADQLLSQLTG